MSSEKATEAKGAQSEMPQRQTEQQMQTEKQKQTEQKREEGLESESASKKNPEIKQESEEQKNPETKKDPGSQENLESQRKQESKENTVQGSSDQTEKVMDSMKISQTERQNRKVSGEEENEKNPKVKKQSAKNEARAASDSIYLTARSSAVTLDKASGVKVGNVKTQLPDGYEGYIRRTAKCETNLGSDVFTAEGGPLDGREDCKTLMAKDKNKYYAWYRKGMYYQGKWVDIKVTLVDFELRDGAFFRFVTDRPGIETCKVEWAETKMEFFRSDNGNAIDVKGYITFQDIDLYQGILMKNGFGNVYVKRAALENLKAATVKGKNYYFDTSGLNQSGSDTGFMLSVLISGKAATAVFTFVRPENNLGTSTTPSGGLVAKAYKMFPNAHPHIEKYVSDSDEKMTSENRLSTREETYTYTLRTMVPIENEETCYHDLSISDQLDDFLEIKNVTVTNENGANAEKFWTIQKTKAFVARCSDIKNTSFYGHTYDFQITVGVKKDAGLEKRWDPAKKMARIKNQASASSDGNTVRSQTVVTNIAPVKSSVSVEKRDGKTKEKLPGAVFNVYEWNGSRYAATPLFQLKNEADGVYESAEILSYTDENKGKFKIIEEQSPEGYTKSGWEKEFVISPFESKKITYHGDNACFNEPLWITVQIQKKDLETGKALSGARFAVYEWNQEQQNYVPYAAWPELVTAINGEAVSGKLYYQKKNEGKFRLQETQPPKNYFGDYVDGEKEKGLKFYDFRITAQNAGQSLELTNNGKQTGFVNTPQMASIAVKKIGEVLTEARDSAEGVIFLYEKQPLAGAKYEITAAEDIYKADGVTLALKKGAVAQQLVTGKDGTAVSRKLYLGRYHVTETEAPQGYVRKDTAAGNTRTVTLSYRGPEIREYVSEEQVFENERPKMQVTVFKRSENTQKGLAGARFGLYAGENILSDGNRIAAKDTLLALAYSKKDGSCLFDADVPCGYRYYVKEIQAPEHYYKQVKKARYEFQWIYQDDKTQLYTFPKPGSESEAVFLNQEVTAEVTVQKVDAQSGLSRPQQMASLKGAVYGIYAKEAITSADGDGEILYEKNAEVMRKETDTEGRLCFTGLPLGTYYVKEIKASEGYLADAAVYTVDCAYEGQDILVIKKEVFSKERIKSQPFTCFKLTGDNKETDLEWMRGAGFSVYSVKELEEKGHLKKGSAQLEDAVLIQEVIDRYRDKDTLQYQKMKALETAAYYDEAGKMQRLKEQFSDENGVLNIRALPYGKYLLVETTVPEGKVAAAPKVLNVDSDEKDGLVDGDGKGTLQMGSAIWDQPQTSYLKIVKKDKTTGETVAKPGAKYVIHDVEGAYFNWYMEDKTSEEKVDYINRFGNLVVAYTNGEMLGSYENPYVTAERKDSDGRVLGTYVSTTTTLPQGLYILEEVQAPEGYVRQGAEGRYRKRNGQYFFEVSAKKLPGMEAVHALKITEEAVGTWEQADIASKDYRVRVQIGSDEAKTTYDRLAGAFVTEAVQENEAAVGKLSIYAEGEVLTGYDLKKGFAYTCKPLAGNVFVVRAAEDIFSSEGKGGEVLLEKGTLLETQKSDKEGNLLFVSDLPLGKYEVCEIAAPDGYIRTAQTEEIDASWKEEGMAVQKVQVIFENQITKVFVKKTASDTKELLEGAKLAIYQGNTCIESWITEKEEHCVEGLEVGKTYTLRELSPAPGYATAAEQVFQMEDHKEEDGTYQGQKLEMQDPPTEVHITVFEKDGDKKVPLGNVKAHLETPQGETLLKENSPMERDGIWESGTEQAEIFKKVAIGHYKIIVDEIPKGYVHPDVTDIEVKDTAEVQKFEVLVEPICIRITGYALSSAAEKKQTRTIRSGIYVHIRDLFEERSLELPEAYTRVPSGSYQVKTDRVPDGYVLPAQTKITVREDTSEIQDFEVEIRPTVIKIEAVDKKTQTPLEGVKISVVNEKGKKIWKHVTLTALKEKVIPSWYTIQVEKVPKGYQKPKNQKIKVKAVANVQKYKVELTKEAQVQTEKRVDTENFDKTTGNDHSGFSSDNTPDNENAVTAAKTGDASWMEMWIFAGLMAASSMILRFFRKKRHIR